MELAKLKLKSVSPTRQLENISFSDSILDFNTTVLQQKIYILLFSDDVLTHTEISYRMNKLKQYEY